MLISVLKRTLCTTVLPSSFKNGDTKGQVIYVTCTSSQCSMKKMSIGKKYIASYKMLKHGQNE